MQKWHGTCNITTSQSEITNNGTFNTNTIIISDTRIGSFINYGTLSSYNHQTFKIGEFSKPAKIDNFVNYGTISGHIFTENHSFGIGTITNYGVIGAYYTAQYQDNPFTTTINNLGIMKNNGNININANINVHILLQNYMLTIDENASEFGAFRGNQTSTATANKNSHLVLYAGSGSSIAFKDSKSKIILDFGDNFELGKEYSIAKLVTDTQGKAYTALGMDFSRLTTRSSLYWLKQSGNNFIVTIDTANSEMGTLYKSNIRTMNNFTTISESLIYPHKYKGTNRGTRKRVIRRVRKTASAFYRHTERSEVSKTHESNQNIESITKDRIAKDKIKDLALDSNSQSLQDSRIDSPLHHYDSSDFASNDLDSSLTLFAQNDESLANYESFALDESFTFDSLSLNDTFFYKTDSLLLADVQSERQRRLQNSTQNLNTRSANPNQSQSTTTNRTLQSNQNYYFILTPFVNHNYFFESGRYNLSGLEYGFVSAFSGKLNNSNSLGTHFVFSYNTLSDDANASYEIKSMNINLGLNYKLDLIWDMYVKARIDGYYFMNNITLNEISKIKPNNIGFGANVSYGKDFNFGNGGILGVRGGLDYKGLYGNAITFANANDNSINEQYSNSLQNLLYVDIGLDYNKYFKSSVGLWGLNVIAGVKGNTLFMLKSGSVSVKNRVFDMIVDNDKVLGYANISGSYVLNTKSFDMEFSICLLWKFWR